MSAHARRARTEAPRLVTKASATPEQTAAKSERYTGDPTLPSPTARADAMGSTVLAYLITGPVVFGGLGLLADRWLEVTGLVALGIIIGMALSLYIIWLRYGTSQAPLTVDTRKGPTTAAQPHNEEIQ
ncbi:hypothetical protein ASG73_16610 [Janibacter sp. Soil728]|uniref:AtpZ/AtpI family protein n=1 Tax=Janibacter sp. Soil728 TaxID=1736393 RepID=UPI0006F96005|nr:AtpZ/AtpI family protein [Janibacter sp. Soil728]KRE35552.1 hypothetical protein ASG73_16610 [Janibacter sp. Soil728]